MAITTTIRLPEELHERLRRHAYELRRPIASIVREAVQHELDGWTSSKSDLPPLEDDPLWLSAGSVDDQTPDASERIDELVYGRTPGPNENVGKKGS